MIARFDKLKRYLVDISDVHFKGQYNVKEAYIITYQNRTVVGFLNGMMNVENTYGCIMDEDLAHLAWKDVKVFKRLKRW